MHATKRKILSWIFNSLLVASLCGSLAMSPVVLGGQTTSIPKHVCKGNPCTICKIKQPTPKSKPKTPTPKTKAPTPKKQPTPQKKTPTPKIKTPSPKEHTCVGTPCSICKCTDVTKGHKCRGVSKTNCVCHPQATNPPPTVVTFGGRAIVTQLTNGNTAPQNILIGDTGPLPGTGGDLEVTVGETNLVNALTIQMAHASTMGSDNESRSEVTIENFFVSLMTTNGDRHSISFDFLETEAVATCTPTGVVINGSSRIEGLVIDGNTNLITGEPNQTIVLPGITIVLNAQQGTVTGNTGDILVAGIFILEDGCLTGPIGLAHAKIICSGAPPPQPPPTKCDRVTGGGFIVGTPCAGKGTFSVGGGIRRGAFWGHLNYKDQCSHLYVKATAVTGYTVVDLVTRRITYDVKINGVAGKAVVVVTDKGESGQDDLFDITLSNGYHAGGDLGGTGQCGGNIQLHKCPPGWVK